MPRNICSSVCLSRALYNSFKLAALTIALLLFCLLTQPLGTAWAGGKLTIAAGAGYKKMVAELGKAFTAESGIEVEQIFGNMGQTVAKAKNSGLVDCVIGDQRYLDGADLPIVTKHEIGRGKLVAIYAKGLRITSPEDVQRDDVTRVAMPDPKKAIYGRAGDAYLRNAGLMDKVKDKLFIVATVPQVSSYVLSKEVDMGFINLTDALAIKDKIGGMFMVDQKYYSPIVIIAAALNTAPNTEQLDAFTTFLASEKAREIATRHGL